MSTTAALKALSASGSSWCPRDVYSFLFQAAIFLALDIKGDFLYSGILSAIVGDLESFEVALLGFT